MYVYKYIDVHELQEESFHQNLNCIILPLANSLNLNSLFTNRSSVVNSLFPELNYMYIFILYLEYIFMYI